MRFLNPSPRVCSACLKLSTKFQANFRLILWNRLARPFCSDTEGDPNIMNTLDSIVPKLNKIAPLSLAGNWDNVGLLVEPSPPKYIRKVMLTNDLTVPVMEEAKDKIVDLIISYHPPIFVKLKSLTQKSWKERLIVDCLENRIAVYAPHTSYDAVEGGVNDWLISAFEIDKNSVTPLEKTEEMVDGNSHILEAELEPAQFKEFLASVTFCLSDDCRIKKDKSVFSTHLLKSGGGECWRVRVECSHSELAAMISGLAASDWKGKYSILPLSKCPNPKCGFGRTAQLKSSQKLEDLVKQVKAYLGLTHVAVAKAVGAEEDPEISSVAVCAGAGSSVLRGAKADLFLTGEMSHHDVLDAIHNGTSVILCQHSNTERGYFKELEKKLGKILGSAVEVCVSETDRDPLEIV